MDIGILGRKHYTAEVLKWTVEKGIHVSFISTDDSDENQGLISLAKKYGIKVIAPESLYSSNENPEELDLLISYLFSHKIKEPYISGPKMGCINFHPAILPNWRGTAGYNIAISKELSEWGATAHFVDENIDTGPIIKTFKFSFDYRLETAYSLERKTQKIMFDLYKSVITDLVEKNELEATPQANSDGVYISRKQMNEMKLIDLKSIDEIDLDKMIRAFWFPPYNGAGFYIGEKYYTLINQEILNDIHFQMNIENRGLDNCESCQDNS